MDNPLKGLVPYQADVRGKLPPAQVETPDYEDRNLRRSLTNFLAALGKRYDGDPQIGFITAGLLGTWGKWHTYPKTELFASEEVQREVMDACEAAFKVTPVLLRYPAGDNDNRVARNADRLFGYHDDSFAWATLDTGKEGDAWFHMTAVTIGEINLPTKQRCILKGFESGEMIGVPPAVRLAAKEQEWQELPMSPVQWQWRPYFIALVVVEPKGLELRRR